MTPHIVTVMNDVAVADFADGVVMADMAAVGAMRLHRGRQCSVSGLPVAVSGAWTDNGEFGSLHTVDPDQLAVTADQYRLTKSRMNRKLFRLTSVLLVVVALAFSLTTLAFARGVRPQNPLLPRLHAYRNNEPALEQRLSVRRLPKLRKELRAIREDEHFDDLPQADQRDVTERLLEFDRYSEFVSRFDPPTIPPNDIRTLAELDQLETALSNELMAPETWSKTEAARLAAKWREDAVLLRVWERRLTEWHRDRARRAVELHLKAQPEVTWRECARRLLAEMPPLPLTGTVTGSTTLPFKHGMALQAKGLHEQVRVEKAHEDAEAVVRRLRCDGAMYDAFLKISGFFKR